MMDIRGLAYVVVQQKDPATWNAFGENVLGLEAKSAPNGDVWLKMDDRAFRIAVQKGDEDRYLVSGWEVASEAAFEQAKNELKKAGVAFTAGSDAEKKNRNCIDLIAFADPAGNRHEIVLGFKTDWRRLVSPTGTTFITGDQGLGHTVLPCPNFDAAWTFFRDVMGFQLSDLMKHQPDPNGPAARIYFLHCNNPRHHSLAIAEMPASSGCIHLMMEVPDMDEVGRAMDRYMKHNVKLMATLGRHVNDKMTSFYIMSPSNFAIEFGYGGLQVDWTRNVVHETTEVSLWGHDFGVGFR
ncbi:MAG: VOC family protein [Proteobacteria bacterium]|nr:VOC family protein [Pseudomonadota bacterium]HQR04391.1 VOC family protein [Rhodocyclaceae bacterium]